MSTNEVKIELAGNITLMANLEVPDNSKALVIFSHGSGSSRLSPRNGFVAEVLNRRNIATMLIVGSRDTQVMDLNKQAYNTLTCKKQLETVEGASHLFEEPGTLHVAANLAAGWFEQHLPVAAPMK